MIKNRVLLLIIFLKLNAVSATSQKFYKLSSPDQKISVQIKLSKTISFSISHQQINLLDHSEINLVQVNNSVWSDLKVLKTETKSVNTKIISPVPEKREVIPDIYNQLTIHFRQPFAIVFRAYNDGVAYRWQTKFKDSITIKDEIAWYKLSAGKEVLLPVVEQRAGVDPYHTSFEELYQSMPVDSFSAAQLAYSPVITGSGKEVKMAITESDLEDYPGMFLSGNSDQTLRGVFAAYPLLEEMTSGEFPQLVVIKRAPYIAKTRGSRNYPWRVFIIAEEDKNLPSNDLVYRLASPSYITETNWIKPGKGTDEWIIGINLFNVPFKAGINTSTYKFYIDFAKKFGLDRIMMDAGWSDYKDLFKINPNLNMDSIAAYAREQDIGLSMWTLCSTLEKQLDSALKQFKKWGVDFVMTDFMDRDDQKMVNFYHTIARTFADQKIMLMFHGAYPPKGLNRTYPNLVTQEGVLGSEYNIWSNKPTPKHNVTIPFTRMLAGPLDYEPGILDNATKDQFRSIHQKVMSQGTRCHQLAMFVVYDSPMQIFSGNPSQGLLEPAFMEFLGSIPTTWNETKILEGKVGEYIITARKKNNDWYIGGMTNWSAREFVLPLNFLDNVRYKAVVCKDGLNAEIYASDYFLENFEVNRESLITIKMAPGGGFVLKLIKE